MPHRRSLLLLAACLILTGCGVSPSEVASSPTIEGTPSPTPSTSSTVSAERTVTITLDGLESRDSGDVDVVSFDDGDGLVSLLEDLMGSAPVVSDVQDPWGNGTVMGARYEWDSVASTVLDGRASVSVRSARVGQAILETAQGVGVGSTRAEVVAAGAWDVWDEDGDGVADWLGLGAREVPGTQSLVTPAAVGREFILLGIRGDIVTEMQAPSNDFSDI